MKRYSLIVTAILFLSLSATGQDLLGRYEYMNNKTAKSKWGQDQFNSKKFKASDSRLRAKMAFSLINKEYFLGKTIDSVFEELGPSTGFFFSESVPAYILGDINEKQDELWQLVFLLDRKGEKVSEVKIQKKCCFNK